VRLLELFSRKKAEPVNVTLPHSFQKKDYVVVNIHSEASSRRLTEAKAAELLGRLRSSIASRIILIGASKEKKFIDPVLAGLKDRTGIENLTGDTSLRQLAEILASARLLLTTDSGPSHLANALGTHTVVLFGAGNEMNTAPYNSKLRDIIRLGQLNCEPCEKNICVRFELPQCLERLDSQKIVETVKLHVN
jgi:ADP-heptose:LPS heptosyltransferase